MASMLNYVPYLTLFWQSKFDFILHGPPSGDSQWECGIFVGARRKSNELMVATRGGVKMARSVRRIIKENRWTEDTLKWVRHAPWHLYEDAEDGDGDIPEGVSAKEREEKKVVIESGGDSEGKTKYVDVRERVPRDFYI